MSVIKRRECPEHGTDIGTPWPPGPGQPYAACGRCHAKLELTAQGAVEALHEGHGPYCDCATCEAYPFSGKLTSLADARHVRRYGWLKPHIFPRGSGLWGYRFCGYTHPQAFAWPAVCDRARRLGAVS